MSEEPTPDSPPPTQAGDGACADARSPESSHSGGLSRRGFLVGVGALGAGGLVGKVVYDRNEGFQSADVFIAKAASYEADLARIVREGLAELGLGRSWAKGKSVLLKPNLVEPSREAPHINTHPAVIRAVAEVFRSWDAREVLVAEGQGHARDTYLVLDESGVGPMLEEARLPFVDLNHDDVFERPNRSRLTKMAPLYLPDSLRRADIVVSLPKMKTHHWAGVTLSMKNLFGVMPGIVYGWPKNVLHRMGISESIVDITAAVNPSLAIVDGIVGMEGDGPLMGDPKHAGVLVMGVNLPAVDATTTRLMRIAAEKIPFLHYASAGRLGPIGEARIHQRGESIASLAQTFALLDHPDYQQLRA